MTRLPSTHLQMNTDYDYEKNDYEVIPDTPTYGGNDETNDNDEGGGNEEYTEKEKENEHMNMKANDKETEETEVNEEDD